MSAALDRVKAAAGRLKVFPLPSVVLLPGGTQPLHIFEQRYRDMVRDALASDTVFAMAQVAAGQEGLLSHKPQLDDMVCAGVVTNHERLEDGRYNLELAGVARARIVRELPQTHLYREVEVEVLPDAPYEGPEEPALRQAVLELIARIPVELGERVAQLAGPVRGGALADIVGNTVLSDVPRRQEMLRLTDVPARMRAITEDVLNLVARLKPRKPEGYLN